MRNIRDIKDLPISELTDEEILKAAFYRLGTKASMLVYENEGQFIFLGRYRNEGRRLLIQLRKAWEEKYGKFKRV